MSIHWEPLANLAQSIHRGWRIELNPTKPAEGIRFTSESTPSMSWNALSVHPIPKHSLQPEELFVRQEDLITRFAQNPEDDFGFQIDWRLMAPSETFDVGVEIWLTVQTSLLESVPRLGIQSQGLPSGWTCWKHRELIDDEVGDPVVEATSSSSELGVAALMWSREQTSFLWLIEPSDQDHIDWNSHAEDATQSGTLFGHFMEKGVIRRARMQLFACAGLLQKSDVSRAYRALAERDLPLTA